MNNNDSKTLVVKPSPHFHVNITVADAMSGIILSLVPVIFVAVYVFGAGALLVLATCMFGAVLGEIFARRIKGEQPNIGDGTALVTGLLLALTLPPTAWWAVIPLYTIGGFLATAFFREFMGGLGANRFNPALLARLFLLIGRTSLVYMAPFLIQFDSRFEPWLHELEVVDALAKATPLMAAAEGMSLPAYSDLLFIFEGGALGETSVLAVLIGSAFLFYRGYISWHIPASFLGTIFVLTAVLGEDPLFHILAGGAIIGAFYFATDWVTSPITKKGKIVFGIGVGILIVFFRLYVSQYWLPVGGVAFSILIMNAFVPYIDRVTRRIKFGGTLNRER